MYYIHRRILCVNRKRLSPRRNGTDYNILKKTRGTVFGYFITMGLFFVLYSRVSESNIIYFNKPHDTGRRIIYTYAYIVKIWLNNNHYIVIL